MTEPTCRCAATAVALLVAVCAGLPAPAAAQQQHGHLFGAVEDDEGRELPGVTVVLTSLERQNDSTQTVTDAAGKFRFLEQPAGKYRITFELEGFRAVEYPKITIRHLRATTVEATLVSATEENVELTAGTPLTDTRRLEAGRTIEAVEAPSGGDPWQVLARAGPLGDGSTSLGIGIEGAPIDRLELGLSNRQRRSLEPGWLTPGWTYDPATASATGPSGAPVYLRLDSSGRMAAPDRIRVEASLGGQTVFEGKVEVEERSAADPSAIPYMGLVELLVPQQPVILSQPAPQPGEDPFRLEITTAGDSFSPLRLEGLLDSQPGWLAAPDAPQASATLSGERQPVAFMTPAEPEAPLQVSGVTNFGETRFVYEWDPKVVSSGLCWGQPSISGVSQLAFAGQQLCVCGCFADAGPLDRLEIGGRPLGAPLGLSPYVANYLTPKDLAPGPYEVGWAAGAGEEGGPFTTEVIEVLARINDEVIQKGGTTGLEMEIVGSERPLAVEIENRDPGKISMKPSNSIRTRSTGGPDANRVEDVTVTGLRRGTYSIDWRLDAGICPCAETLPELAELFEAERYRAYLALTGGDPADDDDSDSDDPDSDDDSDSDSDRTAAAWPPRSACPGRLLLHDDRFRVEPDPLGQCVRLDERSALWAGPEAAGWQTYFSILDGCSTNDRFWVFAAALTDVEYTLQVTDTVTGQSRSYSSPLGRAAPAITDTNAFATCP